MVAVCGFLTAVSSLVAEYRLQGTRTSVAEARGLRSCSSWAPWLWPKSLDAPQYVGSSRIRDQTHVPYIGRQILNPWATREAPVCF